MKLRITIPAVLPSEADGEDVKRSHESMEQSRMVVGPPVGAGPRYAMIGQSVFVGRDFAKCQFYSTWKTIFFFFFAVFNQSSFVSVAGPPDVSLPSVFYLAVLHLTIHTFLYPFFSPCKTSIILGSVWHQRWGRFKHPFLRSILHPGLVFLDRYVIIMT